MFRVVHDLIERRVTGEYTHIGEGCVPPIENSDFGLFVGFYVVRDDDTHFCEIWKCGGERIFYDPLCIIFRLDGIVTIPGKHSLYLEAKVIGGSGGDSI